MKFKTTGDKSNPAILFFHAMGVTGDSLRRLKSLCAESWFHFCIWRSKASIGRTERC